LKEARIDRRKDDYHRVLHSTSQITRTTPQCCGPAHRCMNSHGASLMNGPSSSCQPLNAQSLHKATSYAICFAWQFRHSWQSATLSNISSFFASNLNERYWHSQRRPSEVFSWPRHRCLRSQSAVCITRQQMISIIQL
jgi:hypothetical protein